MNKLKYIIIAVVMMVVSSCNDWLTIKPKDKVEKTKLYETEDGFWQALNGLYDKLRGSMYYHTYNIPWMATSDRLVGVWEDKGELTLSGRLEAHMYNETNVDGLMEIHFLNFYQVIAHANTILAYVDNVSFLSSQAHALIKGEALAIRAFMHFELIRTWGPMPNSVEDGYAYLPYVRDVSRNAHDYSNYADYMNMLLADLTEAENLLAEYDPILTYSNAELNVNSLLGGYDRLDYNYRQHHMNYYGVCALRARVALWMGDVQNAITYARTVINATNEDGTKKFTLGVSDDVTTAGSEDNNNNSLPTEHVFGTYVEDFNWDELFASNTQGEHLYMSASKLTDIYSYNSNDWRAEKWYVPFEDYVTTVKFRHRINFWLPFIRLSEMYLILAEELPISEANVVYQEFCSLKGLPTVQLTENERQIEILMEYYKEFIAEGQLFFVNKRMEIRKVLWLDEDMAEQQYVLPLPDRETNF